MEELQICFQRIAVSFERGTECSHPIYYFDYCNYFRSSPGYFYKTDWITIIIVSASVLAFECFNTAIENLCDFVTTEKNDKIRKIKDLAAAGVLISAIGSAFVGLIIFIPEILDLFG